MTCPLAPLEACAHGFLDAAEDARVRSHAAGCGSCAPLLASFEREHRAIASAAAGLHEQDPKWDRLLRAGLDQSLERPKSRFIRRLTMAAPLLCCAFIVWSLVRQDPSREVAELVEKLRSDRIEVREAAARRLTELGESAAPKLKELARDPDAEIAARARKLLEEMAVAGRMTPELRKIRPGIERRLPQANDRAWTEEFLEAVRQDRPPLTPEDLEPLVTRALRGAESADEKISILREIANRGLKVGGTDLIEFLDQQQFSSYAAKAISKGGSAQVLREIVRRIDQQPQRFYNSTTVKILQDADPAVAVPEVLKLLDQENKPGRGRATWILGELRATEAVPRIRQFASDRDTELRRCAAFALGNIGAPEGIPELVQLLEDRDFNVRVVAAQGIAKLRSVEAVPALLRLLQDPQPASRGEAIRTLGALRAKEAIPELIKIAQNDPVESNRWSASASLAALGARNAVPVIVAQLDHDNFSLVMTALQALLTLGAEEAIPEIAKRMDRFNASPEISRKATVQQAAAALAGLSARQGIPALLPLLTHGQGEVRLEAAKHLCLLGSREGVPVLLQESDDLACLNAIREPELWKRLQRPFEGAVRGGGEEVFRAVADAAGLKLDLSAAGHLKNSQYGFGAQQPGRTVLQFLTETLRMADIQPILARDTMRIVPRATAVQEWKTWWEGQKK